MLIGRGARTVHVGGGCVQYVVVVVVQTDLLYKLQLLLSCCVERGGHVGVGVLVVAC